MVPYDWDSTGQCNKWIYGRWISCFRLCFFYIVFFFSVVFSPTFQSRLCSRSRGIFRTHIRFNLLKACSAESEFEEWGTCSAVVVLYCMSRGRIPLSNEPDEKPGNLFVLLQSSRQGMHALGCPIFADVCCFGKVSKGNDHYSKLQELEEDRLLAHASQERTWVCIKLEDIRTFDDESELLTLGLHDVALLQWRFWVSLADHGCWIINLAACDYLLNISLRVALTDKPLFIVAEIPPLAFPKEKISFLEIHVRLIKPLKPLYIHQIFLFFLPYASFR